MKNLKHKLRQSIKRMSGSIATGALATLLVSGIGYSAMAQNAALKWVSTSNSGTSNPIGGANTSFKNNVTPIASATDANGNTYVVAGIKAAATLQTTTPPATTGPVTNVNVSYNQSTTSPANVSSGSFLTKYDKDGAVQWVIPFSSSTSPTTYANVMDVEVNSAGEVVVLLNFTGSFDMDPGTAVVNAVSGSYSQGGTTTYINALMMIKYSSAGNYVSSFGRAGNGNANTQLVYTGIKLAIDNSDNIILAGSFDRDGLFPSTAAGNLDGAGGLTGQVTVPCQFFAKYSTTFGFAGYNYITTDNSCNIMNVTTDSNNDIYAVGNVSQITTNPYTQFNANGSNTFPMQLAGTDPDMFIAKYSGATLNATYANIFTNNGGGDDCFMDIKVSQGFIYATAYYRGTIDFDQSGAVASLSAAGDADVAIAKYNAATGAYVSAKSIGGTRTDAPYSIAVNSADNRVYVSGYYLDSVDFNPGPGVNKLYTLSTCDGFVAAYNLNLNYVGAHTIGSTASAPTALERGMSVTTQDSTVTILGEVRGVTDYDFSSAVLSKDPGTSLQGLYLAKFRFYEPCFVATPTFSGGTIICGGNTTITANDPNATSYSWSNGLGNSAAAVISAPGTYTVTASSSPTCSKTASIVITNNSTITQEPVNVTTCATGTAMFFITATGSGNSYTWKKNGTPIPNSNNDTLILAQVTAADTGLYFCDVISGCNGATVTSISARLSLTASSPLPTTGLVLHLPYAGNFNNTSPVALSVVNVSSPGFAADRNGEAGNAGAYNGASYTKVTHNAALNFTTQFTASFWFYANSTVDMRLLDKSNGNIQNYFVDITGQKLRFAVAGAVATSPVAIQGSQWYHVACTYNGSDAILYVNGVQSASTPCTATMLGNTNDLYVAAVMGFYGGTSFNGRMDDVRLYNRALTAAQVALLRTAPSIQIEPQNATACAGQTLTLSTKADVTANRFVWYKGASPVANSDNDTLKINNVSIADTGSYYCVAYTNCDGSASLPAKVTVTANSVSITAQPQSQAKCVGQTATFSTTATGGATGYQWKKNGTPIQGANSSSYTTAALTIADSAAVYTCDISGGNCGSITTADATLQVNRVPVAAITPATATICSGAAVNLTASGQGTYTWSNALGSTALVNPSPTASATYTVTVSNNGCTATASAAVTVNQTTTISTSPATQTTCTGAAVTLTVSATGANLSYQWRKGGNNIGGQTSASLNFASITAGDAGSYDVVVTGACGTTTSAAATLTVTGSLQISQQPQAVSACAGTKAILAVTANGAGVVYQWTKNGNPVANSNNDTLTFTSLSAGDAGSYICNITSSCGNATSNAATVTVKSPTTGSTSRTICFGSTFSFNGQILSQSGSYKDTLVNAAGCDSILTLNLTVRNKISTTLNEVLCNGQSISFNQQTITAAGQYLDTLQSATACDSFVVLNVTIAQTSTATITESACGSYVLAGNTLTASGVYTDTITNTAGCDSVITLNLTILDASSSSISDSICAGASYSFGTQVLTTAGTYSRTIANAAGCDSVITLNLFVRTAPVANVTASGSDLTATAGFATYYWLLDGNYIQGANADAYTAAASGDYAVIVSDAAGCSAQSNTVNVVMVGIADVNEASVKFSMFPNPATDMVNIAVESKKAQKATVAIYDLHGKLVAQKEFTGNTQIDVSAYPASSYQLYITSGNAHSIKRLIRL